MDLSGVIYNPPGLVSDVFIWSLELMSAGTFLRGWDNTLTSEIEIDYAYGKQQMRNK